MKMRLSAIGLVMGATVLLACSSDDDDNGGGGSAAVTRQDVVKQYAALVHENYEQSIAKAKVLQTAVHTFVDAPTDANLQAARKAWTEARPSYGQTEAFRFYGGPIDGDERLEARINAWPIDEGYVDYVKDGVGEGGIINDASIAITKEVLSEKNGAEGETNVSTGWHAIEFLLWGQDFYADSPGKRSYTDYVTGAGEHKNQERRREYLKTVTDLLVDDLETVEKQWHVEDAQSYAAKFTTKDPIEALTDMVNGIGRLSVGELANERMFNAFSERKQEEEHSCFSDTTLQDLTANAKGIENVYLGRYGSLDGAGIDDLVKAKNPALDARAKEKLSAALTAIAAIPAPFDQAIVDDAKRPKIQAAMDSLQEVKKVLAEVGAELGLTINLETE